MFCGDFSGWTPGGCGGVSSGLLYTYFSVAARPVISDKADPEVAHEILPNPEVPIFDARTGDETNVPDEYKWPFEACITAGKAGYVVKPVAGLLPGQYPPLRSSGWSVNLDTDDEPYEAVFHGQPQYKLTTINRPTEDDEALYTIIDPFPGVTENLNNVRRERPKMPYGSWVSYEDGVQKYVHYLYWYQPGSYDYSGFRSYETAGTFSQQAEWRIATIDIASQTLMQTAAYGPAYGSRLFTPPEGSPYYKPNSTEFNNMAFAARCNFVCGHRYVVHSSYCALGSSVNSWGINRVDLQGSNSSSPKPASPNGWLAARPSFHQRINSSAEDGDEPWVIAKHGSGAWGSGVWLSKVEIAGDDPSQDPYMLDSEVRNELVPAGELPANESVNLCYNRMDSGRELAVFYDFDSTVRPFTDADAPTPPAGDFTGWRRNRVLVYDSMRTPSLYEYERQVILLGPDGDDDPGRCFTVKTGVDGQVNNALANFAVAHSSFDVDGRTGIPTFITEDREGDVWIGSPQFVEKHNGVAGVRGAHSLRLQPRDQYPVIPVQVATSGDCGNPTGFVDAYLPFSALRQGSATKRYDFGNVDYRAFAMIPTGKGIELRGMEATLDWATTRQSLQAVTPDGTNNNGWYADDTYYTTDTLGFDNWTLNWTVSIDGSVRIPHTEQNRGEIPFVDDVADANPTRTWPDPAAYNSDYTAATPEAGLRPDLFVYRDGTEDAFNAGEPINRMVETQGRGYNVPWYVGNRRFSDQPLNNPIAYGPTTIDIEEAAAAYAFTFRLGYNDGVLSSLIQNLLRPNSGTEHTNRYQSYEETALLATAYLRGVPTEFVGNTGLLSDTTGDPNFSISFYLPGESWHNVNNRNGQPVFGRVGDNNLACVWWDTADDGVIADPTDY